MTSNNYHTPVLLQDCIEGLNINPIGTYVDVTYGGGGHSREILKHLTTGKLIAFDQDEDALSNKVNDDRLVLVNQNFRNLNIALKTNNAIPVDGILADLGVSSHQFDSTERGFSIRFDAELDMRMSKSVEKTAADIVNNYSEDELRNIFRQYGELDHPGKAAWRICEERKSQPIKTVVQLKEAVSRVVPRNKESQYYAQLFQALRIEVNGELDVLKELLTQSLEVLKPGGRLVVMSYHSLEDRLVKNFIRSGNFEGTITKDFYGNPLVPFKMITKKPVVPNEEELSNNSRSRSAKLRVAEKL